MADLRFLLLVVEELSVEGAAVGPSVTALSMLLVIGELALVP
jgi:hypothetical protein